MQSISKNDVAIAKDAINIAFSDNEISDDVRIIDFLEKSETGETVITLCSAFFMKGPVRLEIKNGRLKIIVSEFVDVRENVWMPVTDWQQYTHHSYTRLHSMQIPLYEENYCIVRQLLIPTTSYLKVILTKSIVA